MIPFRTALVGAMVVVAGCSSTPPPAAKTPPLHVSTPMAWQSKLLQDHPLVGRVWDGNQKRMAEPGDVATSAATAKFVLLGEKHDNPDHHVLQARVLQAMIDRGRRPSVAFEMLESGTQDAVNLAIAAHPRQPEALAAAVGWQESGWPPFSEYEPVFAAALGAGLPVIAANLPATQARLLVKHGPEAMAPVRFESLGLGVPLPKQMHEALSAEIRVGHCGMLPERLIEPMVLAQRARDAVMADRLVAGSGASGGVLIAGGGHVRTDRGVPRYLARVRPLDSVLSIAFVEVQPGDNDPATYDTGADLVWFTPRWGDDDPCETMRAHMKKR